MLPKGYLIGNLTADPVSSVTTNSNNYSKFSVACNDNYIKQNQAPKAHFYNCIAWGKKASYISTYIKKGDTVFLEFFISTNNFTNSEGKVVRTIDLLIERVEILRSRSGNKNEQPMTENLSHNEQAENNFQKDEKHEHQIENKIKEEEDNINLEDIFGTEI